jgi:predicted nucleic acid-binding protein
MSGNRFVLDTNAVIQLLKGNEQVLQAIQKADFLAISIITQLEFFAFPLISDHDQVLFNRFLERIDVVDLSARNTALIEQITALRTQIKLKLPDAIIAATALNNQATLLTADTKLLKAMNTHGKGFAPI